MRRGPLLDCVAHVTQVSSQGVNHQVSVIRICLEILLYFDNSTAHISLSPEQKGPTGLKHFKVTTVQSVGDRERGFCNSVKPTHRRLVCKHFLARQSSTHLSEQKFFATCPIDSQFEPSEKMSCWVSHSLLSETAPIRKAHAVRFLWPVAVIAGVIVDYCSTMNYIRRPLSANNSCNGGSADRKTLRSCLSSTTKARSPAIPSTAHLMWQIPGYWTTNVQESRHKSRHRSACYLDKGHKSAPSWPSERGE